MPNQRSTEKVFLGGYVERGLSKQVELLARKAGMAGNKFGFVTELIRQALKRRKVAKAKQRTARGVGRPKPARSRISPRKTPKARGSRAAAKARRTA